MAEHLTSARADDDLLAIYLFGLEHFGRRQAVRYLEQLEHVFTLLAENPRMGRKADAIAAGVRRHEHRAHVILYQEEANIVRILAIVHGKSVKRLSL